MNTCDYATYGAIQFVAMQPYFYLVLTILSV
jgi:hypothetical protein